MDEDVKMVNLQMFNVRLDAPFDIFEDDQGSYNQAGAERESLSRKAVWEQYQNLELSRMALPSEVVNLKGYYFPDGNIQIAVRGTLPGYPFGVVAAMSSGGKLISVRYKLAAIGYGYEYKDMHAHCVVECEVPRIRDTHMLWLADTIMSLQQGNGIPTHKTIWWKTESESEQSFNWPFHFIDLSEKEKYEVLFPSLVQV